MHSIGKNSYTASALCVLLCLSGAVQADLTAGTVTNLSATRNIPYNSPTTANLRWSMLRVSRTPSVPAGVTVNSTSGSFTDAGNTIVLGTVNTSLTKSIPLDSGSTFTFNETVRIPRAVLLSAFRQNIRTIFYRREFTDCPAVSCSSLALSTSYTLAGSSAGVFGIAEYSLRFGDGKLAAIVTQGETLQAEMRINVTGTGTLKGVWEVASPASTAGTPFYQTLQLVTRQVSSGQTVRLLSPPLPVRTTGNYLVRFRFLEPALEEDAPQLQYVVQPAQQAPLPVIPAGAPADGAEVGPDTVYQWRAIPGAHSYKLEIVGDAPRDDAQHAIPVTGVLLRSEANQASLTRSLMQKLETGRNYWWHVLALDADGNVIAVSDWRRMTVTK